MRHVESTTSAIPLKVLQRIQAFRAEAERCLSQDCPRCESATSAVASACTSRSHETERGPICRWREHFQRDEAMSARVVERQRRLIDAGYSQRQKLKTGELVIPTLARAWQPPTVPNPCEAFQLIWEAVRDFERDGFFLTLAGGTGIGKSIAAEWLVAGTPGAVVIWPQRISPGPEWSQTYQRALTSPLAVFDDAGQETLGPSRWHVREVEMILTARYAHGLKTVVCTNRPLDGAEVDSLASRYGDRVASRLDDQAGGCVFVECGEGVDLRRMG